MESAGPHAPEGRRHSLPVSERRLLLAAFDAAAVGLAFILAYNADTARVRHEGLFIPRRGVVLTVAAWIGCGLLAGAYDLRIANRLTTTVRALGPTLAGSVVVLLGVFFLFPYSSVTRSSLLIWAPIAAVLVLIGRIVYQRVLSRSFFAGRIILVARASTINAVWPEVKPHIAGLYRVVGIVDPDRPTYESRLRASLRTRDPTEVIVGTRGDVPRNLFTILLEAHDAGVPVRSLADLYEEVTGRMLLDQLGHSWLMGLPMRGERSPLYRIVKRSLDIIAAMVGLVVLGLVLPLAAVGTVVGNRGRLFYSQQRVGRYGKAFTVHKIRTMRDDPGGASAWTRRGDVRVTAFGRVLRVLHIDELPQAWNILRGDMSIVGPRPEQPQYVAQLREDIDFYSTRMTVRPGLTGWAQVNHGYTSDAAGARIKLSYDLYYVKHQSLTLDLLIIGKTIVSMVVVPGR